MSLTCVACGRLLPDGARFCSQCGRPTAGSGSKDGAVTVKRRRLGPTKYAFTINRDLAEFDPGPFIEAANDKIFPQDQDRYITRGMPTPSFIEEAEVIDGQLVVTFSDLDFGTDDLETISDLLKESYEEL